MTRTQIRGLRQLALAGALAGSLIGAAAMADGDGVPMTGDLQALGTSARDGRIPIVLLISREHCPMCARVEQEVLGPMLLSGEYADRAILREIGIDEGERLRDFDGRVVPAIEVARRYDTYLTPTLLFLDASGSELAPRIRGVQNMEFYGYYVDQAIDLARDRLRRDAR